jgi:hypothetical protein
MWRLRWEQHPSIEQSLYEPAAHRACRDSRIPRAEPPAWRVLLAYARPYRLTLVAGGLLSLATGAVGLSLPLTAKRLVDDLAHGRSVTLGEWSGAPSGAPRAIDASARPRFCSSALRTAGRRSAFVFLAFAGVFVLIG